MDSSTGIGGTQGGGGIGIFILACGTGHLPNLISTPAKAHGCNVQLMLIESLESQHIRRQEEAPSSARAVES